MDQEKLIPGQMFWSNTFESNISTLFYNTHLIFLYHEKPKVFEIKVLMFSYFYCPKLQIKIPLYPDEIKKLILEDNDIYSK